MNQKQLWEKLAKENSRYYINSDKGRNISEEDFIKSGEEDCDRFVFNDPLIEDLGSCLEIGCGTGRMTEFLADFFPKVYAVDISGEMIRQGKERLQGLNNIEWVETNGETLPFPTESVDFIFSYIVFQHIKTPEMVQETFKEAYRVLQPYGLFKVRLRTDNVDDKMDSWWAGVSFSKEKMDELIKDSGFKLLDSEPVEDYGIWLWLVK